LLELCYFNVVLSVAFVKSFTSLRPSYTLCLSLIYLGELYTVRGIVRWFYIKQDLPKFWW